MEKHVFIRLRGTINVQGIIYNVKKKEQNEKSVQLTIVRHTLKPSLHKLKGSGVHLNSSSANSNMK